MNTLRFRRLASLAVLVATAGGCTIDRDAGSLTGTGSGSTSSTATTASDGVADTVVDDTAAEKLDLATFDLPSEECVSVMQTTSIEERPSDILVVVDHAVSNQEHQATFQNFSLLIADAGIEDARVVMLAGYPSAGGGVCIDDAPLGVGECPANDNNPPTYLHVDEVIQTSSLLSQVLATHGQWGPVMRPEAWRHVWVLSAADASMPTGEFVTALEALDEGFERLTFHAMVPDAPNPGCSSLVPGTAAGSAEAYKSLAMSTDGVFEPLCNYNVKILFEQMLERIQGVALSCSYEIPPAPAGQIFDQQRVNVDYDDGTDLVTIGYVPSISDCPTDSDGWHYDDETAPTTILMCPSTCARFDELADASIEIRFGCATVPAG